jgi:hypothetical protein
MDLHDHVSTTDSSTRVLTKFSTGYYSGTLYRYIVLYSTTIVPRPIRTGNRPGAAVHASRSGVCHTWTLSALRYALPLETNDSHARKKHSCELRSLCTTQALGYPAKQTVASVTSVGSCAHATCRGGGASHAPAAVAAREPPAELTRRVECAAGERPAAHRHQAAEGAAAAVQPPEPAGRGRERRLPRQAQWIQMGRCLYFLSHGTLLLYMFKSYMFKFGVTSTPASPPWARREGPGKAAGKNGLPGAPPPAGRGSAGG